MSHTCRNKYDKFSHLRTYVYFMFNFDDIHPQSYNEVSDMCQISQYAAFYLNRIEYPQKRFRIFRFEKYLFR